MRILRTTIILLSIIILVFGGIYLYFVFFDTQNTSSTTPETTQDSGLFPTNEDTNTPAPSEDDNIDTAPIGGDPNPASPKPTAQIGSQLRQITSSPVIGYTVLNSEGGETLVRYMEAGTGYIFDYNLTTRRVTSVSNKLIANAFEVIWNSQGNEFITTQLNNNGKAYFTYYSLDGENGLKTPQEVPLTTGDNSTDVLLLQKFLNSQESSIVSSSGPGAPDNETTYFGSKTEDALLRFQEENQIPKTGIYDARTKETIANILQEEDTPITETALFEKAIPETIISISPSHDGKQILYIEDVLDTANIYISSFDFSNRKFEISQEAKLWEVEWLNAEAILFTTTPSEYALGYTFIFNPRTDSFEKIAEGEGIIATGNADGDMIFISAKGKAGSDTKGYVSSHILNQKTDEIITFTPSTLADKCAWESENVIYCGAPIEFTDAKYPDDWYKGLVRTEDTIWRLDTETMQQTELFNPLTYSAQIDVYEPRIEEKNNVLLFQDKNDLTLWSFSIDE